MNLKNLLNKKWGSSANHEPQHNNNTNFTFELAGNITLTIIIASIFLLVFMNALLFPDCNRMNQDCFVINMAMQDNELTIARR